MVRVRSSQLAADYRAEFEQMLVGRFGTAKTSATPYRQVQVGGAGRSLLCARGWRCGICASAATGCETHD